MTCSTVVASRRRACILLLAVLAAFCLLPALRGDPTKPGEIDPNVTQVVARLLVRDHLSGHKLDDEISQRALKTFLKSLDPWKLYFYQSDVDTFMQSQNDLDDMARKGDMRFAYTVFGVFLKRVDERVALAEELLGMPHDFTADEKMISDRDDARYAQTAADARDRWRKRVKYDLLMLKVDGTEGGEARKKLTNRYESFKRRMHQTDGEELLETFLNALTTSFDPHTSYMSPDTYENFLIMMRLELEGIGASLAPEDEYTVVKKIIPGGAADKQGELKVDDKIVGVGEGAEGEVVDTVGMKLKDVVKMIRGKPGTDVRLEVVPGDGSKRKLIKITRAKIELTDSEARGKIFEAGRKPDNLAYKIGVIDLPSFYMDMEGARNGVRDFKSTTRDVRRILEDFNHQGVDAVILDLRRNGGGSLSEAIGVTGLFIDEGPVVEAKDSEGRVQPYYDLDPGEAWSGPLVVLISKFSASASEILAGAIQDYHRGLIVGDHATHGKGTVQSLTDIGQELFRPITNSPQMGALKTTTQQFYRPNGESTQKRGVLADIELPSLTTYLDVGEADLDYPVEFDSIQPQNLKRLNCVDQALCDRLRYLSEQRRANSPEFQKVLKNIARYKEQKNRKYVTLNEEKFLKERAELNADKEEQKTLEQLNEPDAPAIKRDYYLNEALAITADYLGYRQVAKVN
jgi:carboxyl-terminal processing protease